MILYSLVSTCEKNGVNPEVYIRDVLMRLPDWPKDRVAELLPHRWNERTPRSMLAGGSAVKLDVPGSAAGRAATPVACVKRGPREGPAH